jgi:hypothetical protein
MPNRIVMNVINMAVKIILVADMVIPLAKVGQNAEGF